MADSQVIQELGDVDVVGVLDRGRISNRLLMQQSIYANRQPGRRVYVYKAAKMEAELGMNIGGRRPEELSWRINTM